MKEMPELRLRNWLAVVTVMLQRLMPCLRTGVKMITAEFVMSCAATEVPPNEQGSV